MPNTDSREELAQWAAAREAELNQREIELNARQHTLDLQEARIASKARLCVKCQGALEQPTDAANPSPDVKLPPPRTRVATTQGKMPPPLGTTSPSAIPPLPTSYPGSLPTSNPRVMPPALPSSASMRIAKPPLSATPTLNKAPSASASASVRLPARSPARAANEAKISPPVPTPPSGGNISAEVSAFLADYQKLAESSQGSFPGCLLEGFMVKKGAKVKSWKRRYFVLQASGKLMYFENSDGRKLLGQLQVTSESSVGVRGNGGEGEEGGLWVCPEPNGRIYEFEAGDAAARDKWITALNSLIGPINMPRQWKQKAPEKASEPTPSASPAKVRLVVQIPGYFFKDGQDQGIEAKIYPDEKVADVIRRAVNQASLIPGLQKEKLLQPRLTNEQGEVLDMSQVVHPLPVVVLQEGL